ncbi:MAG: TatD family hydrolase [Alphaproteobacteria bacterium]|nr:TatD family hydrolase [Alphaproteobacteria bacterium]MCB9931426.1 TatD family hydrolase [Alphaproteobacteria bacterium]
MLVDSHCHLDFPELHVDLDAVVARARNAGIGCMLTICTRVEAIPTVLAIAERYPEVYAAIGIHPHSVEGHGVRSVDEIVSWTEHPKVVGIGETGLDYYYDKSPREMQRQSFVNHIEASRRTGLPFIVHTRNADADTAAILDEAMAKGPVPGLLHCFSSGRPLAEHAVRHGLYVSFSGMLTFRNADDIRATAKVLPSDRLLVETDAPFLAPVPKRGKTNEPAFTIHTAACLAEVHGVTAAAMAETTTDNFFRLFAKIDRTVL